MEQKKVYVEPMYDSGGSEVDGEGIPYRQTFSQDEYSYLCFMVFRMDPKYSDLLETDASKPVNESLTAATFQAKTK